MQTNLKLMELRPDRSLLNSNFDGYKLSLHEIPTITEQLKVTVDRLKLNIDQYSLLHAKLFMFHNHLFGENDQVYFIDKEFNIHRYTVDALSNRFKSEIVWKIPFKRDRASGDYNVSLKFIADKNIAVVSDGKGYVYVLDRGEDKWLEIFSGEVAGPDQNFILVDAVHKQANLPQLHLLLLSIRLGESVDKNATILHWITLEKSEKFNEIAIRELSVQGFIQYSSLERNCEAIYVVSENGCKFTLDSENQIKETQQHEELATKYSWTQSKDDITVKFQLPQNYSKKSIFVNTAATQIAVKYEELSLLQGPLYQRIDPDLTCWTIEDNTLQITLQKVEIGLMWPEIVEGNNFGEYVADPALIEEISERLAPLTSDTEVAAPTGITFNSQQVEECDFECDKLTVFERISCDSHNITHRVNLGSHKILLSVNLEEGSAPAFAVRNDVDACIWQPKFEENKFSIQHKGTLHALSYVQASKQQMKFFTCSPDMSYSVICESMKHIFIYCQNKTIAANELRNRITGQRVKSLAQQQVYNLPSNEEILGIFASNTHLYVLGEMSITALKFV